MALSGPTALWLGTLPVTPNNRNQLATWIARVDGAINASGVITVDDANADGVTDDYAIIQAALTLAATAGYGVVYLPPGRYLVNAGCLALPSNVVLRGAGMGATTIVGGVGTYPTTTIGNTTVNSTIVAVGKNHCGVEDLTIDHQTNSTSANGIAFEPASTVAQDYQGTGCSDVWVRGVEVLGYVAHQYLIWGMRVTRMTVEGCTIDGYAAAYVEDQNGIEIYGGYDVHIHKNKIRRCAGSGICVVSPTPAYDNTESDTVTIEGNQIRSCNFGVTLNPVYEASPGAQNLTDIIVRGNTIKSCNSRGVYLLDEYTTTDTTGVLIAGNLIDATPIGIAATSTQAKSGVSRAVRIVGNVVRNASHASLGAIYATLIPNLTIEGNEIYNATYDGIRLTTLTGARIAGNRIHTTGNRGIHGDALTDCTITDNTTDATTQAGIFCTSSPVRVVCTHNHIRNVPTAVIALFMAGGDYCAVNDNDFYRAANSTYEIAHTGTNRQTLRNVALGAGVGTFTEV